MTEQDLKLNAEQQAAREAVRGLGEVPVDPTFRSRLGREFSTGMFSPHRSPEPVSRSSFGTFMRWMYVPVAAGLLIFATLYWNQGPQWEVIGTSPTGTLTVNGESVSVTDQDRLDGLLASGGTVALSPKTELTLKSDGFLTVQITPGTTMDLPSRPHRWFGKTIRTAVASGEARFITGPDFPGQSLVMTTTEGRAEITGTLVSLVRDPAMGATCVCVMHGEARIGTTTADMELIGKGWRKVMFADGREPMVVAILPEHRAGLVRFQKQFGAPAGD